MELALAGLMFFAVLLLVIGYNAGNALDPVQARLQQIAAKPRTLEELELQRPVTERTLKPLIRALSGLVTRFYPANTARSLELKLKKAGMETTSTDSFLGIKADQLGVSMSKVLRVQSETLRVERRQRAEEKAARTPVLIMLPTVGCIFPSLFIVILAPAALTAMKSCGSV